MNSQAKNLHRAFFAAVSLGLAAIGVLADAMRDQGVTITQMPQGYADAEEDLERLAQVFPKGSYEAKLRPAAAGRALRGGHGYC